MDRRLRQRARHGAFPRARLNNAESYATRDPLLRIAPHYSAGSTSTLTRRLSPGSNAVCVRYS